MDNLENNSTSTTRHNQYQEAPEQTPPGIDKSMKKLAVIITVAILAIVIVMTGSYYLREKAKDVVRTKAKDAAIAAYAREIQIGLEIYFDQNKTFPSSLEPLAQSPYNIPAELLTNYFYQKDNDNYNLCVDFSSKKNVCGDLDNKINYY